MKSLALELNYANACMRSSSAMQQALPNLMLGSPPRALSGPAPPQSALHTRHLTRSHAGAPSSMPMHVPVHHQCCSSWPSSPAPC
mmetsp:Transcript_40263/g.89414  ORF Transcript_40263/g.89414 Transcript_40263/m.89414 type:complete len:85 (-) Transcript_40263:1194-1448(-)